MSLAEQGSQNVCEINAEERQYNLTYANKSNPDMIIKDYKLKGYR